jgi:hypothetical protein
MLACAAACLLIGGIAGRGGSTAPPPSAPSARAPLAGPRVDQPRRESTLLRFDFSGRVADTDEPPEFEALKGLGLSPQSRAAVDALALERSRFLDDFVSGHIDLLVKFGSAAAAQNVPDVLALLHEALGPLRPLVDAGPLAPRVRALLPAEQAERYDAALREYWTAVIADGERTLDKQGNPPPVFAILARTRLESFGHEIERAFKRVEASGDFLYTYLVGDLGLTASPPPASASSSPISPRRAATTPPSTPRPCSARACSPT